MAKVRFLQSAILLSTGKTYGFNDELEISDEKLLAHLIDSEIVDVLIEEKPVKKPSAKAKKEVKTDAE